MRLKTYLIIGLAVMLIALGGVAIYAAVQDQLDKGSLLNALLWGVGGVTLLSWVLSNLAMYYMAERQLDDTRRGIGQSDDRAVDLENVRLREEPH